VERQNLGMVVEAGDGVAAVEAGPEMPVQAVSGGRRSRTTRAASPL
jgi:hypothetical protein